LYDGSGEQVERLLVSRIAEVHTSRLTVLKPKIEQGGTPMVTDSTSQTRSFFAQPWTQLVIGIICMVMIANLQYGWTLFVGPIGDKYHWSKAAIQVTFTIFVLLETWLVPAEGLMVAPPKVAPGASRYQAKPLEMLSTPVFWVMYLMFIMMAAGGLMATAQLAPIAKDFKIADTPVSLIGLTMPALTFALSIDRILNGLTRPFFGWVSDQIGREQTMFIAFLLEGLGIIALANLGTDPVMFVLLSGLVFFAWGEIYSLFPSIVTDTFGATYATTNTGLMYTAKGTASLLVPLTSVIAAKGNWHPVFMTAAILNILAALMAIVVLKPMRSSYTSRTGTVSATPNLATH